MLVLTINIVKQIPNVIKSRINRLPSSKTFNHHMEFYNEALYNWGYKNELEYLDADKNPINTGKNIGNNGHQIGEK